LNVGAVVTDTLSTLAATAIPLLLLALPLIVIPQALISLLPEEGRPITFLAGLPGLVFQGAAVKIAYGRLSGDPVRIGEAARAAARRFGSLWGSGILYGLGVLIGLVLLVAPGLILMAAWMVYQPVLMIEGARATAALDRSWTMTKGVRWPLAAVATLGLVAVAIFIALMLALQTGLSLMLGPVVGGLAEGMVTSPLLVAILTALCNVGTVAVYVQLKRARDGVLQGEIAEVFS